jgi:hypothetical protein
MVRRGGQGAVRWERENDAYYPRDKYRDIKEYFGTRYILLKSGNNKTIFSHIFSIKSSQFRARMTERDGAPTILISRVRPEDKGVYRFQTLCNYSNDDHNDDDRDDDDDDD